MEKKLVAIGGGENGRKVGDTYLPYETETIDQEIVRLTGKEHPNFLLLSHALPLSVQENYFQTMLRIYKDRFGCHCKDLKSDILTDSAKVQELLDWADIIYEGGGDTPSMVKLWRETGFDAALRRAWESGKVLCGVSAGANCWFEVCSTDTLRIQTGDDTQPLTECGCLGFLEGFFVPHCDEPGRIDSSKALIKENHLTAFFLSNCAALEVVGEQYRVVTSSPTGYGAKGKWVEGSYRQVPLEPGRWYPLATMNEV